MKLKRKSLKLLIVFTFCLIIISCNFYFNTDNQPFRDYVKCDGELLYFPLKLIDVQVNFIDTTFVEVTSNVVGQYPPIKKYRISGFLYEISLTIFVESKNTNWDEAVVFDIIMPNNNVTSLRFNHNREILRAQNQYTFVTEIHTKTKGWAKVKICYFSEKKGKIVSTTMGDKYRTILLYFY